MSDHVLIGDVQEHLSHVLSDVRRLRDSWVRRLGESGWDLAQDFVSDEVVRAVEAIPDTLDGVISSVTTAAAGLEQVGRVLGGLSLDAKKEE